MFFEFGQIASFGNQKKKIQRNEHIFKKWVRLI